MPGSLLVAEVEHGRKCRRLSRSGRAHHEDEAALFQDEVLEHGGQAERVERRDGAGNVAHHDRGRSLLPESADAEAADALQSVGRVQLERVLVLFPPPVVDNLVEQAAHGVRIHRLLVDGQGNAADFDIDGRADHRKISEAFLSAISWNIRFTANITLFPYPSLGPR